MRRALTLFLGVALFGILAAVVVASQGADDPAGRTDTVTETVERTTTVEDNPNRVREQGEDISGPCAEAEHASDPRCNGQAPAARDDDDAAGGVDISGPCDEAEHANDPRCTGASAPTGNRVDNSGPGSLNSGPGSGNSGRDDDGDGHSGHGGGDDSGGDDHGGGSNSGPGGGGDDD
jgi:uncharacterized membrane protein YgcG